MKSTIDKEGIAYLLSCSGSTYIESVYQHVYPMINTSAVENFLSFQEMNSHDVAALKKITFLEFLRIVENANKMYVGIPLIAHDELQALQATFDNKLKDNHKESGLYVICQTLLNNMRSPSEPQCVLL